MRPLHLSMRRASAVWSSGAHAESKMGKQPSVAAHSNPEVSLKEKIWGRGCSRANAVVSGPRGTGKRGRNRSAALPSFPYPRRLRQSRPLRHGRKDRLVSDQRTSPASRMAGSASHVTPHGEDRGSSRWLARGPCRANTARVRMRDDFVKGQAAWATECQWLA